MDEAAGDRRFGTRVAAVFGVAPKWRPEQAAAFGRTQADGIADIHAVEEGWPPPSARRRRG